MYLNQIISSKNQRQRPFISCPLILFTIFIVFTMLLSSVNSNYITATITPTSLIINAYTSYTFTIIRNFDSTTNTPNIPLTLPSTAYILLIFPNQFQFQSLTSTSTPSCINLQTQFTLNCTLNLQNNTLTISQIFTEQSMTNSPILSIQINDIKNPNIASQTSNFYYSINYQNTTIIDQSPPPTTGSYSTSITFLPDNFISCTISANNYFISTPAYLTFTLTSNNPIPLNGILVISVPFGWDGDVTNTNTVVNNLTCLPLSGLNTTQLKCPYKIFFPPINTVQVTISSLSASVIPSNTTYSISLSSILTPPYINDAQQISIYSAWNDGTPIDTCSVPITNTIPIPFKSLLLNISSGASTIQSIFNASLQMVLNQPFSNEDQIILILPNNFFTNNHITITSPNYPSFSFSANISSNSSTQYTQVSLSNFGSSPSLITINTLFQLFLLNITNYVSTQPQTITITMCRQQQPYQSLSINYSSTIGTLSQVNILSDSTVVNGIGNSTIQIWSQYNIPLGSYIQLQYNSAINSIDTPQSSLFSTKLNGLTISGVKYQIKNNIITITNLFQTPFNVTLISDSSNIQFTIPTFINPPTNKPTPYIVTIYSNTGYPIAKYTYMYIAALQSITGSTLTSSSYQVMDTNVSYSLTFVTKFSFKSVSIMIPPQISILQGYQQTCSSNAFISCQLSSILPSTLPSSYINLTFIGSGTAGLQTLQWGNNINPNSFKPTLSFQIYTYIDTQGVQQSTSYIILSMNTSAKMFTVATIPSTYKNSDIITLEIDFVLLANSPNGTLSISTNSIDITNAGCNGNNIETCQIIPPIILIPFTNTNSSILHSLQLFLTNVKNSPSYAPIPLFSINLTSTDNYQSIFSQIPTWTNNILSTFDTLVSSDVGYMGQNAQFSFNITNFIGQPSYIQIQINPYFGPLTTAPLNSILINPHRLHYNISSQSPLKIIFTIQVPTIIFNYTFTLFTYTSNNYLIGTSTSNNWTQNCPDTKCRQCYQNNSCINCYNSSLTHYYLYILDDLNCIQACPSNYYLQQHNNTCIKCYYNCLECINSSTTCTKCLNINNEQFYYLQNNQCVTSCSKYKYPLNDTCITCANGYILNDTCVPCPFGTYSYNSECYTCPNPCRSCTNQTTCSICAAPFLFANNFCVTTCPINMIPNDTKCDICQPYCKVCNQQTLLCSICQGGKYMSEGLCVSSCPNPYLININYTLCVTQEQYSKQYSSASKPLYFPFTIASILAILIGIGLKCYTPNMHFWTFLVAIISMIEQVCWITFIIIQHLFYINYLQNAIKSMLLVVFAIITLLLCNIIFLLFFCKYFTTDPQFVKWQKKHWCINRILLSTSSILNFKLHRLIYTKFLDKQQLSLVLTSIKKLIPISTLSFISLLINSVLVLIGCSFALYYSLSHDQQFFNALDTLIITSIMIILTLIDMKHPHNYFINQLQSQNIKNIIYQQQNEFISQQNLKSKLKINQGDKLNPNQFNQYNNISSQNFISGQPTAQITMQQNNNASLQLNHDFKPVNASIQNMCQYQLSENQRLQTINIDNNTKPSQPTTYPPKTHNKIRKIMNNPTSHQNTSTLLISTHKQQQYNQQQQKQDYFLQQPQQIQTFPPTSIHSTFQNNPPLKLQWVQKQFDHFGYSIKYDSNNNLIRRDQYGNYVQIDDQGIHHLYDEQGYQLKQNPDKPGHFIRTQNRIFLISKTGHKFDLHGYRIELIPPTNQNQQPTYKYYDENGNQVIFDLQTNTISKNMKQNISMRQQNKKQQNGQKNKSLIEQKNKSSIEQKNKLSIQQKNKQLSGQKNKQSIEKYNQQSKSLQNNFQLQYQTLNDQQNKQQFTKRQKTYHQNQLTLQQLQQIHPSIQTTPKPQHNQPINQINSQLTYQPITQTIQLHQSNHSQSSIHNLSNPSLNKQTLQNQPNNNQQSIQSIQHIQQIGQISTKNLTNFKKNNNNFKSQANYSKQLPKNNLTNSQVGATTRSQIYHPEDQRKRKIITKLKNQTKANHKIFDSQQQVQSLQQQTQWNNEKPFHTKNNYQRNLQTKANSKTHQNNSRNQLDTYQQTAQLDDQNSPYQSSIRNNHHLRVISRNQQQFFDNDDDNNNTQQYCITKRSKFVLDNKPNLLIGYAKNIDNNQKCQKVQKRDMFGNMNKNNQKTKK